MRCLLACLLTLRLLGLLTGDMIITVHLYGILPLWVDLCGGESQMIYIHGLHFVL